MPNWIFREFLDDPTVYDSAKRHWEQLFRSALPCEYSDSQLGINYRKNTLRDGNPIFTAIARSKQLAVRIIQQPVGQADDLDLDYWVDSIGPKSSGLDNRELVIACCPSEENQTEVRRILREWFTDGEIDSTEHSDDFSGSQLRLTNPPSSHTF